jgi:hypothetical protein
MSKYSVLGAARSSGLRSGRAASFPQHSETADGSVKQCESPGRFPRLFPSGGNRSTRITVETPELILEPGGATRRVYQLRTSGQTGVSGESW